MKKTPVVLLGILFFHSLSWAQNSPCKTPSLYDYTVYSTGDINVQQSDYQGLTGASGTVVATNFQFNSNPAVCFALTTGQNVSLQSSSVNGNIESRGEVRLDSVGAHGSVYSRSAVISYSNVNNSLYTYLRPQENHSGVGRQYAWTPRFIVPHEAIVNEMVLESTKFSQMQSTASAVLKDQTLIVNLKPGKNVVNIVNPKDLQNAKLVVIRGDAATSLIINTPGTEISLDHQEIDLEAPLASLAITWNFYQATFLHLSHTLNASYGMPGKVMAPLAMVEFNEALITGALYAGTIITSNQGDFTLHSGQVNRDLPVVPHGD